MLWMTSTKELLAIWNQFLVRNQTNRQSRHSGCTTVVRAASFQQSPINGSHVCYSRQKQKAVWWSQTLRHTAPTSSLHKLLSCRNINRLNFPWGMFRATSEHRCVPTYGFVAATCRTRISGGLCPGCQLLQLHICCILRGPGGERIVDIVPGGTEFELQLTHWGRGHLNCLNARSRGFEQF